MTDTATELKLLAQEAVALRKRIEALNLPRADKSRRLLEYELTKIRLQIRDKKRVLFTAQRDRRPGMKRLIPYAGADYK